MTGYLATAIFGPDRADHWRAALADAGGSVKAGRESKAQRPAEIEVTIANLTRRVQRQILNLEG